MKLQRIAQRIALPLALLAPLALISSTPAPVAPATAITAAGPATTQEKRPLTHDDYDAWRSIAGEALSPDGRWLLYAEMPQEEDAELVVRDLEGDAEYRHGLGALYEQGFFAQPEMEFSRDSTHVVFLVEPTEAELKEAEEADNGEEPTSTLGILDLGDGSVVTIERIKGFELPQEAGGWLAYLKEAPPEEEEEAEEGEEGEPEEPEEPAAEEQPEEEEKEEEQEKKDKDYGTELVLRSLADGSETSFQSVLDYTFTDDGAWLIHTVSSEETPESDGVYAHSTADATTTALLTGEGNYEGLALNEEQTRLAFITDRDDYEADEPTFDLYGWDLGAPEATLWVSHRTTEGFPEGYAVSSESRIELTDDGGIVLFGIAERPEPEEEEAEEEEPAEESSGTQEEGEGEAAQEEAEDEEAEEEEEVEFDLWHWNDPLPQPQQKRIADDVRSDAWESVYFVDEGRFVQLADEDVRDVWLSDNGETGYAEDRLPYRKLISWEGFYSDVYVVDPDSGERTLVAERVSYASELSADGRWVSWYGGSGEWIGYDRNGEGGWSGGSDWYLYDVEQRRKRNLTAALEVPFERQDWDTPNIAPPYGDAGFTEDGELIVYDEFDVWAFPGDGGAPRMITEGVGRESRTQFRIIRVDREADFVPTDEALLLLGTNVDTMATGLYVDSVDGSDPPRLLVEDDVRYSFRGRAEDAPRVIFTRQSFSEFPDLWVAELDLSLAAADGDGGSTSAGAARTTADIDLGAPRKVTDLGSQMDPFLWGRAELRDFRSADGYPLKGILIVPEDFDPEQQYPLMVYIYETLHRRFHTFRRPSPGTSINPTHYVSNGYVLWMPDIEYRTPGYPGKDALKCVLPGIHMLIDEGFVDPDAIGIQGHSWGGYQIAYMVTQTDVFAAAEAGAPVSNMTSAYGGIRWGSGLVRQFQYERTQSRLGASLWEVPLRFIENSPLFWADEVETPLLMIHNDDDGAVPWYQGIELIMALRRLGREAYMFNYNNEKHGLRERHNQEHWTRRMQEFFDHHLRGAPAPEWMTEGIPAWEKEE